MANRCWDKIGDSICWAFGTIWVHIRAVARKVVWWIKWPWLWLSFNTMRLLAAIRSLRFTGSYTADEGKHLIAIQLRWHW
jgi:hypothetical protein